MEVNLTWPKMDFSPNVKSGDLEERHRVGPALKGQRY